MNLKFLVRQARYGEAFKLAGIEKPREAIGDWFKREPQKKEPEPEKKEPEKKAPGTPPAGFADRFHLGIEVAKALHAVGEKQAAKDLFAQLGKEGEAHSPNLLFTLVEAERRYGLSDEAFQHGLAAFVKAPNEGGVRRMFPNHPDAAVAWWRLLQGTPPKELLIRVNELLSPGDKKKPLDEITNILADTEKEIDAIAAKMGNTGLEQIVIWRHALGETALAHGHKDLAETYFAKAFAFAENAPADALGKLSTSTSLRLGRLQADREKWAEAAAWYHRAWERSGKRHAAALYLMGHALEKNGQVEEGSRHIKLAKLLPLGDQRERHQLAAELEKFGMMAEAVTQWELVLRVGAGGDDWYVNDSHKELGNAISGKDDLRAADHWDTFMRSVLRTSSAFIEPTAYLTMPHLIHRIRARGLMKAGKVDEALKEIKLAQSALPGDTNLPLDLVPLLEKAGRKKEADELFAAVYTVNRAVIDDFPNAALYLNNTAWLCGRSNRKLDEAFNFAQKAVKLAPEKAGYLDTLAEVHFRRGNKDEAIALMKKCIAMEPNNAFFKEQLKRFEE